MIKKISIPAEILKDSSLTPKEQILYGLISEIGKSNSEGCVKTNRQLSKWALCGLQSISNGIHKLIEKKYIVAQFISLSNGTKQTERHLFVINKGE